MNKNYCPICLSELIITEKKNKIFNTLNYYCSNCDSYHIIEPKELTEYYTHNYHKEFNFKKARKFFKFIYHYQNPRAYARKKFLSKNFKNNFLSKYLEIGGGNSENFIVFNLYNKPKAYIIVEPNSTFNLNRSNLKYYNCLFEDVDNSVLKDVDIVIMFHVLEHIFDLKSFFERIINAGCKFFYFEVPNIHNKKVLEESLLNHPHYHHFSKKSLEYLFNSLNIKVEKISAIEPITYHPYKKVKFIKRITFKSLQKNEKESEWGLYLRGIVKLK